MNKLIFSAILGFLIWHLFFKVGQVEYQSGVIAAEAPTQTRIASPRSFMQAGYTITPLASFKIKAKVLSRQDYHTGRESDLSPIDLALGWGRMSDTSVLKDINISQSNRWYRWRVEQFPIPQHEIETHSANMHMIPANEQIKSALKQVKNGSLIELKGQLVSILGNDGWRWQSSLTREDTGNGSCEVIWVEDFYIHAQ